MTRMISNIIHGYLSWRMMVWKKRDIKRGIILKAFSEHRYRTRFFSADALENKFKNRLSRAAFVVTVYEGLLWRRPYILSGREEKALCAWEKENLQLGDGLARAEVIRG